MRQDYNTESVRDILSKSFQSKRSFEFKDAKEQLVSDFDSNPINSNESELIRQMEEAKLIRLQSNMIQYPSVVNIGSYKETLEVVGKYKEETVGLNKLFKNEFLSSSDFSEDESWSSS